jgi:hypothetical protein
VDADHASDVDDRRSTSGYVFFFNSAPISWATGKQKSASSSTSESEFKATHKGACEAMHEIQFNTELGFPPAGPITLFEDNTACEAFVRNPVLHGRMKHIDIAYHVVKEWAERGLVRLIRVTSEANLADGFTKPLPPAVHVFFVMGTLAVPTFIAVAKRA